MPASAWLYLSIPGHQALPVRAVRLFFSRAPLFVLNFEAGRRRLALSVPKRLLSSSYAIFDERAAVAVLQGISRPNKGWNSVLISQLCKVLVVVVLVSLAAGCKLAVIAVEGGAVNPSSGEVCQPVSPGVAGAVCIHEIDTTNYSNTFYATPDAGWYFAKWNSGGGFLCKNSINVACVVSNVGFAGNALIEAIVGSDQMYYIMPIFKETPDTVTVDGNEWYQPSLFRGLSWNEINGVCPGGECFGELNGRDLTGWTWAPVSNVNALFNSYIGSPELGPGPDSFAGSAGVPTWATQFFRSGWQVTFVDPGYSAGTLGWTATSESPEAAYQAGIIASEGGGTSGHNAGTSFAPSKGLQEATRGGWFYR